MRQYSRTLRWLAASCVCLTLASCATTATQRREPVQTPRQATEPVALSLWHIWSTDSDSNRKPFEKALGDWNREHPEILIRAQATESETYKTRIRTAVAVNEAPDIFYSWGAGFARPFVDSGKVLALDPWVDTALRNKLLPGTLDNFTYGGKVYGLPVYLTSGVFYCNQVLFDQLSLKVPQTFGQLLEVVRSFRNAGVTPMVLGEKDEWPGMFYHNVLAIRTAGTEQSNAALAGKTRFDLPAFTSAAQKLDELVRAGAFDSRSMNMTPYEAEQEFKQGKVPMYYNGSWSAGSLEAQDSKVRGHVTVHNFPVVEGAAGDASGFLGGAIDTFMISSGTRYPREAVQALKTLDEQFCRESYLAGAGLPAWHMTLTAGEGSPLMKQISELMLGSTGFVLAWDTCLPASLAQIHKDLVADVFAGRITPQMFSDKMQNAAAQAFHP